MVVYITVVYIFLESRLSTVLTRNLQFKLSKKKLYSQQNDGNLRCRQGNPMIMPGPFKYEVVGQNVTRIVILNSRAKRSHSQLVYPAIITFALGAVRTF